MDCGDPPQPMFADAKAHAIPFKDRGKSAIRVFRRGVELGRAVKEPEAASNYPAALAHVPRASDHEYEFVLPSGDPLDHDCEPHALNLVDRDGVGRGERALNAAFSERGARFIRFQMPTDHEC